MISEEDVLKNGSYRSDSVVTDYICPLLSYNGIVIRCRKDCELYWKTGRKCSIKGIAEALHYQRR